MASSWVPATVRVWYDDLGWGVLDSPETPGGCWSHYSAIQVDGHRTLAAGQQVVLSFEDGQDGYAYRAAAIRIDGSPAVTRRPETEPTSALRSHLTIEFDDPKQ